MAVVGAGALKSFIKGLLVLAFASAAGASPAATIGYDAARHLLNRTGFAASEAEVRAFASLTREQAAKRLLNVTSAAPVTPPPRWVDDAITPPRVIRALSDEERKEYRRDQLQKGLELREWWLREMLATASPLSEKMTLFWHNHFLSSQQKVKSNQLMYRQNMLLRRHALGDFATMLHEVARDPAMVIYLDSASNRKGQPNENFAREVMELFTLAACPRFPHATLRDGPYRNSAPYPFGYRRFA